MSIPSNIPPLDRIAARRFASEALAKLHAVYRKWILLENTRPQAKILRSINDDLRRLIAVLGDVNGDHYAVMHDIDVITAQLMLINDELLLKAVMDIASARHQIVGPNPSVSK